jgi:Bacterial Death-like domain 3
MQQSVQNMLNSLVELNCALTDISGARAWTAVRWRQESTGLRTCLEVVEANLAALPAQCRPWPGSDDQAIQLGKACSEIIELLQKIEVSLNYLNGELSDGVRTRELNIFTRSSTELQRAIRGLQQMLTTLYVPSHPYQERAPRAPVNSERAPLTRERPQDAPSPPGAETRFTSAHLSDVTQPHGTGWPERIKSEFCWRIGENWQDLADLLGVPLRDKERFPPGNEPRALWEWLERRRSLAALPGALRELGRDDLADMWPPTP